MKGEQFSPLQMVKLVVFSSTAHWESLTHTGAKSSAGLVLSTLHLAGALVKNTAAQNQATTQSAHKCPELQLQGIWQSLLAPGSVCLHGRINGISECSTLRPRGSERPSNLAAGKELARRAGGHPSIVDPKQCSSLAWFFLFLTQAGLEPLILLFCQAVWYYKLAPHLTVPLEVLPSPSCYFFFPFDILRQGLTM